MIKRHEDQLWARLDQLYANGTTYVSWGELYHWYGLQRIAKAPWRDIKARWEQLLEEKDKVGIPILLQKKTVSMRTI